MSNLKHIRTQIKVNQSAVADLVGVSQGTIGHYENGRRIPDITMCWKIVKALNQLGSNCTFEDVFPDSQTDHTNSVEQ